VLDDFGEVLFRQSKPFAVRTLAREEIVEMPFDLNWVRSRDGVEELDPEWKLDA
jgi:hypothetical protein